MLSHIAPEAVYAAWMVVVLGSAVFVYVRLSPRRYRGARRHPGTRTGRRPAHRPATTARGTAAVRRPIPWIDLNRLPKPVPQPGPDTTGGLPPWARTSPTVVRLDRDATPHLGDRP